MPRRRRTSGEPNRPFDASTKHLLEWDPGTWLAYVGLPTRASVAPIDVDVSTVVAAADKVIRVDEPRPWLVHVEALPQFW